MKMLSSSGKSLVVAATNRSRRKTRVPYAENAFGFYQSEAFQGASGKWYYFNEFELSDGVIYFYPNSIQPDLQSIEDYSNEFTFFSAPVAVVGYYGEWFNYVARANTFDKINADDVFSWLAAH